MTTKLTDWADKATGEFNRKPSVFRNFVSRDPGAQFPPEKNRYHLFVSYACPWAHRTLIVRQLKGLEDVISFSTVHWHMKQGGWHFATPDEASAEMATAPEPVVGASFLRDIYHRVNPDYSGRYTVPVLWDTKNNAIVSNESSEIIRMFYEEFDEFVSEDKKGGWLLPEAKRAEIDAMNEWVYDTVNNGVYKAGFATSQGAYESAVGALFESLGRLEGILAGSGGRYLLGSEMTEVDVRLFTTVVRFDPVYVQHFKCNVGMIRHDYPAIHKWLRHLYWDIPAFKDTTNFEHIKKHYTKSHTQINPHSITPVGPLPDIVPKDKE
ncbi:uncharacterized protein LAJ45_00379 [Morchella importuna]|nr:uncharacterized protein LAJ45_00379 [Morchella importuna]KAH8155369.1 hypothetical protein LAJ45_00379 [Morchella importuna]